MLFGSELGQKLRERLEKAESNDSPGDIRRRDFQPVPIEGDLERRINTGPAVNERSALESNCTHVKS